MNDYVGPVVTTDSVVLRATGARLEVLVHRRAGEPFAGEAALPGVYVQLGETIEAATVRCVRDKGGVDVSAAPYRTPVTVYDVLGRDPRGHALSVVTATILPPHAGATAAGEAWWEPVVEITDGSLAFDHVDIVRDTVAWLLDRLWTDPAIFRALLGDATLSTAHLREASTALGFSEPSASNFRRKVLACGFFEPSDAIDEHPTKRGRPSRVWSWRLPN